MAWREVKRYKVCDGDGNPEELILERNDEGIFRLKNDFGNMSFEFDPMSGVDFARKMLDDIKSEIEHDINSWWGDGSDFDSDTEEDSDDELTIDYNKIFSGGGDCDGQPD